MVSVAKFTAPSVVPAAGSLQLTEENWCDAVVQSLYVVLENYGHVLYQGGHVIPPNDPSTLFTTAGIQHWRDWVLAASPESDPGRVGPQWCVRMNNLEKVGYSNFLTSFCMLSSLTRGPLEREQALARMFDVFVNQWGLPFDALSFAVTGAHPLGAEDTASVTALEGLGVRSENYIVRPRQWACPFKPYGPAGPELFILLDTTQVACGANCSPTCNCGRYFHFWNLEFLENRRLPSGGTERLTMPFLDSASSIDWVVGAITRTFDLYDALPFRTILHSWNEMIDGKTRSLSRERVKILTDHARTIALLLGAGVKPDAKKQGHVLRRLIRRSFALQTIGNVDLSALSQIVEKVYDLYRHHQGFPLPTGSPDEILTREAARFGEQVTKARKVYERISAESKATATKEIYQLHAEHGLPWELVEHWLSEDGVTMNYDQLAVLRKEDKDRSRGQ